jgi:hypothetical protein
MTGVPVMVMYFSREKIAQRLTAGQRNRPDSMQATVTPLFPATLQSR